MDAKSLIKKFEGFKSKAYKCPANKWTIGYGFTYNPSTFEQVKEGQRISEYEAERWLDFFCKQIKNELNTRLPQLKQNQIEALISFVFNIGLSKFYNSTMYKLLLECEYKKAEMEFEKWTYANKIKLNGLVKRRNAEKNLFTLTTSAV